MRLFIRPPRRPSTGARLITRALGARLLRRNNSRYRYRTGDRIINWGNSLDLPGVPDVAVYNPPSSVRLAVNKPSTWRLLSLHRIPTVEWTADPGEARDWLINGDRVMTRALARGSQGRGIKVYSYEATKWTEDYNAFIHAAPSPLYVKVFGYNPLKVTEYRAHVVDGVAVDWAQKMRRRGTLPNPYIRSHGNGWILSRSDVLLPMQAAQAAEDAVGALGLDFGTVDLAVCEQDVCVYEVNTAPGLDGDTSRARIAQALREMVA